MIADRATSQTKVKVTWLKTGYCTHPEAIALRGGRWQTVQFPALVALIQHPTFGNILFDTGYSERFFRETQHWPNRLYALITPTYLQPEESAVQQLQQRGISPESIRYIVISHFHADHIGGLADFPNAKFICAQSAYEAVKQQKGLGAVKAGFLEGLLPSNFEQQVEFVEHKPIVNALPGYFETGFDLFGDRSLIAIELPGHATGQIGLIFVEKTNVEKTNVEKTEQCYFLVADACWSSRAYQEFVSPHPIAQLIFSNPAAYRSTLQKLHQLHKTHPEIRIIPTHCADFWREYSPQIFPD